ncbi:hypothetical protein CKA32_004493 [Geitlerinema sp. FC II]|nr:hypothetical protein CKA32_004493 [Geitlerinema sp. FC II]
MKPDPPPSPTPVTRSLAIANTITSVRDVETRFSLRENDNLGFFPEWHENLPELTQSDRQTLDRIRTSYLYNSAAGNLTEATVNLLLVSPLLYLAGFCDPPFRLQAEAAVEISVTERDEVYRGRIDILVLQNRFWLAVVESKQTRFSVSTAIPQTLAYMAGNPESDRSVFGLVTNGDHFVFLKAVRQPTPEYGLSTDFSIYAKPENQLYDVLQVLKRIAGVVAAEGDR